MQRIITAELLDHLPAEDRRAMKSRRDLQRVNAWMGNAGIFAGLLRESFPGKPPKTIVELGAGDGTLLLRVAELLAPEWNGMNVTLVDRQRLLTEKTAAEFAAVGWRASATQMDVFEWLERPGAATCDVCIANLFLHHFAGKELGRLLRRAAEQSVFFAACEPERDGFSLLSARLLRFIGCNDVTLHDAKLSVRAGFAGREISQLWPGAEQWRLSERKGGWSTHCFVAQRSAPPCAAVGAAAAARVAH